MSEDKKEKKKSGRTPEQQAARDARKAAKKAALAAAAAEATTSTEEGSTTTPKKRRASTDGTKLEIDLSASAPLSKAEARAARKRAKRGEEPLPPKQTEDGSEKPLKAASKKKEPKPKQEKGQFSVWIGNLSFRTSEQALREFIETGITELGGEAGCVTRLNLPKKAGHGQFAENKGFAYCDFTNEAMMLLALGLSERPLEGRRLLIKRGDDHRANPDARTPKTLPSGPGTAPSILQRQKNPESATLFVGNLPFDVTEEELRDLRSGLIKTRVAQFEDTGRCKGFAFWDFKSSAHAKAALMNRRNHFLRGQKLNVQFASESATSRAGRGKKAAAGGGGKKVRPGKQERDRQKGRYFNAEGAGEAAGESTAEKKGDVRGKKWEASGRPRPGAALAMAQREKVGIVESQGNKITFD
ncbi:RNA-binding protein rnp24 [Trichosporon asahii var. asahii CBS 2479]|uniref:RNA-binding protein rnp24 n=1 Tax=Trichosporon asahii var. asahii (strain ATCC 90039 / CBS 2479 / JCM 2466 / KCTC 7840 / NBRC 103889/ NCYC 2677 / UAMH 7654) TaxID=1186058 RepID=J6F3N5_TRIAS|nr:RNA-binding protein rnp24 [Trichosporon asahii var. asahii CBS 2479]EJT49852.1 RNA-binding protein rnp24 [Trichosporon asahii var. asahii CBS 2479]